MKSSREQAATLRVGDLPSGQGAPSDGVRMSPPSRGVESDGVESDERREDAVGEPGVGDAAAVREEKKDEQEPDARDASEEAGQQAGTLDPKPEHQN